MYRDFQLVTCVCWHIILQHCIFSQYAWWDLAFHMIPFADIDLDCAKSQLLLALTDRYQHPNGQVGDQCNHHGALAFVK